MPLFVLDADVIPAHRAISLRLTDEHGRHLGASQVRLDDHPAILWEGLFDTRGHVLREAAKERPPGGSALATAEGLLEGLGVFLGQHVLGPAITGALAAGVQQRTLLIRLPDAAADPVAAALARVPWEIARPAGGGGPNARPLAQRNVVTRAVLAGTPPSAKQLAVPLGPDEALRALLVYAHAPGSRPLAARLEREQIVSLFVDEIMPGRRVAVDVLCHGVTRERLRDRVKSAGGYHIVHWSGHGHHDALELAGPGAVGRGGSKRDTLRGAELVDIFAATGGFIPQLVFLSACHSGALLGVSGWEALSAWLRGETEAAMGGEAPPSIERAVGERTGYTGAALELLRAGVPQVVAMRYEVNDAYARELAVRFYRALLAQQKLHAADAALALARGELAEAQGMGFHAVDPATPLIFGAEPVCFEPAPKRSPALDAARPRPQPLLRGMSRELDPADGFVGREEELARLASSKYAQGGSAVALIHGPAGIGKTALAAEAIHLWHRRFDWVLAFQAKPSPLSIEELYRQVDKRLFVASPAYRARRKENELAAVSIEPGVDLAGNDRLELMRENLLVAMGAERILLVLDNFDANLSGGEVAASAGASASLDPQWDKLLEALADRLRGGGSRVLITSRRRLAAITGANAAIEIALGPLPIVEAALFLETCEPLRALVHGSSGGASPAAGAMGGIGAASAEGDRELARRVIEASRGHPMILRRLGDLAAEGREALAGALHQLSARGAVSLPDLFAGDRTDEERASEQQYLDEVARGAVDLLVARVSVNARRLLWVIARAEEPRAEDHVGRVWTTTLGQKPPPGPLFKELKSAGLVITGGATARGGDGGAGALDVHDLIKERIDAWIGDHAAELAGLTEELARRAYSEDRV